MSSVQLNRSDDFQDVKYIPGALHYLVRFMVPTFPYNQKSPQVFLSLEKSLIGWSLKDQLFCEKYQFLKSDAFGPQIFGGLNFKLNYPFEN